MDYQTELKRLEENEAQSAGDFWKPEASQYRVKALSELEDGKPFEEEGKEPQKRKQIRVLVQDSNKEYTWTMPYGITPASTYGQLVRLGTEKKQLIGQEFGVVVTGSGKNKRFTIVL